MISGVGPYLLFLREFENRHSNIQRRILRDNSNIFEMPDSEFLSSFRMSKYCFKEILDEVSPCMKKPFKSTSVPPILKLQSFIRFMASGSYQAAVGSEHLTSMCQTKVSMTIHECLDIFETHLCPKWIRFQLTESEQDSIKEKFYRKFDIPGVIGCVDGTHIKLASPGPMRHLYYNLKGYYSINAMIICDCDTNILYVDARSPGSKNDADIWRSSVPDEILRSAYDDGRQNTWLLGDSGYQLQPYLMTPYRNPQHKHEEIYNRKLCKARSTIERCFRILKNRFRCILGNNKGLYYSPETCTKIVNACCALHNICMFYKNYWEVSEDMSPEPIFLNDEEEPSEEAVASRDQLAWALAE